MKYNTEHPDSPYSEREKQVFLEEFKKQCFILAADIITSSGLSEDKSLARIAWNNISKMVAPKLFRSVEKLSNNNKTKLYATYEETLDYVNDSDWTEII
jgi:hypothetical protein